jgi:hypothetical protein
MPNAVKERDVVLEDGKRAVEGCLLQIIDAHGGVEVQLAVDVAAAGDIAALERGAVEHQPDNLRLRVAQVDISRGGDDGPRLGLNAGESEHQIPHWSYVEQATLMSFTTAAQ